MRNYIKAGIAILAITGALSACKGGVSGEGQDSTMVNKEARDSTSALNSKAGTMAHDSSTVTNPDSLNNK